ncbi:MAG: hypothetical protein PHY08_13110 [Candidatus Cloacimonetes bacterium]|nr:hypothetical protein [Candidatus Cloacimonadota bacterium]
MKIDGEKCQEFLLSPKNDSVIQVGKGNIFKLVDSNEKNRTIDAEKKLVRKI